MFGFKPYVSDPNDMTSYPTDLPPDFESQPGFELVRDTLIREAGFPSDAVVRISKLAHPWKAHRKEAVIVAGAPTLNFSDRCNFAVSSDTFEEIKKKLNLNF